MSDLIEAARRARENAYAPYSDYKVGAAVRGIDGRIWSGCNVENISYPLGVCAERNAVAEMVRDGCREIAEVAVVTKDGGAPCGGCRQVLLEFTEHPEGVEVHTVDESGVEKTYTLFELIPHAFSSAAVSRTER